MSSVNDVQLKNRVVVLKWHNIWCPLGLVKRAVRAVDDAEFNTSPHLAVEKQSGMGETPLDRSFSEPFEEAIPDQRVTMVERAYEKGTWWLVRRWFRWVDDDKSSRNRT